MNESLSIGAVVARLPGNQQRLQEVTTQNILKKIKLHVSFRGPDRQISLPSLKYMHAETQHLPSI